MEICTKCGGEDLVEIVVSYHNLMMKLRIFCLDCGQIFSEIRRWR
jgi:hypothetical protein